ncbi:capsule assembly Wzi family protein [Thalassotalea fusca]
MNLSIKAYLVAFSLLILANKSNASGVSPYLPLKNDFLIELEMERLATIAQMPTLANPYHIVTVVKYLEKVKHTHPTLYKRINHYIKRYKRQGGITQLGVELGYSDNKTRTQANNRGVPLDSVITSNISAFYQINEYLLFSGGGTVSDGSKFIPHNTYMSFGTEYFQFDLGYREHWLSPMQESALTASTNAQPAPSITLSNVTPITDWNVKYEMSVGILEEMQGIHFNDTTSSGRPGFLTMHLSIQPFDWWTLGGTRTFMFAGGERSVSLSNLWKAIIDPVSGDNCGGDSDLQDCAEENGNQIATVTSKFDFSIGSFPVSLLAEYGGEDTKNYSYELGNVGWTMGLFLPYLTENISVYGEYTNFHTHWYVHHLYDEGYRNDMVTMGHWWGDVKALDDKSAGNAATARLNWHISPSFNMQLMVRSATVDSSATYQYERATEAELKLKQLYKTGFLNYGLNFGKDINGESYYRVSFGYNW